MDRPCRRLVGERVYSVSTWHSPKRQTLSQRGIYGIQTTNVVSVISLRYYEYYAVQPVLADGQI